MAPKQAVPYYRVLPLANPAAGADFTITGPGQGGWRLISVRFRLTADATVAGREPALIADDGTTAFFQTVVRGGHSAGATQDYGTVPGAFDGGGADPFRGMPWPEKGIWLEPGWRVRSSILNLQAGDQISNIGFVVEEFPTGPLGVWLPTVARVEYDRS